MARRRRETTVFFSFVLRFVFLLSVSRSISLLIDHGERWMCTAGGYFVDLGWKLSSNIPTTASLSRESKPLSASNRRPHSSALNLPLFLSKPLTADVNIRTSYQYSSPATAHHPRRSLTVNHLTGPGFDAEIWLPTISDEANISLTSRTILRSKTLPALGRRTLKIPEEHCCDSVRLVPLKFTTPRRNLPTISLTDGGPVATHPTYFPSPARSLSDSLISDINAGISLHHLDPDVKDHHRKNPSEPSLEGSLSQPMSPSRRWRLLHMAARRSNLLGRTPFLSKTGFRPSSTKNLIHGPFFGRLLLVWTKPTETGTHYLAPY